MAQLALLRVRLHLAVQLLLHAVGMPDVVEVRLAVASGGLDVEVATPMNRSNSP